MEDFRMALVQQASPLSRKARNLAETVSWARRAARAGARLVLFPELGLTGHAGHVRMIAEAEPVPGPATETLAVAARELDLFICAGIAEEDRGIHYNTQFLVGPHGYVGKQRKVHLSGDEYFHFRGGVELPVFDLPLARVGIIICYDNLHPEIARCLGVKGAELLLCPHAARFGRWPKHAAERRKAVIEQKDSWRTIHRARAYDNGCYVALVNAVGPAARGLRGVQANHAGGSMLIAPTGTIAAESRSKDIAEEMVVASLEGGLVSLRRQQTCFTLRTRRPEVFEALTRPTM